MPTFTISVNNKVLGTYVVKKPVISIGRSRTNTISIASKAVSRNHVRIELTREGWNVTDLGSLNGTYINDIRVTSAFLSEGDRITVGSYAIVFSPEPAQEAFEEEGRPPVPQTEPEGADTDVRVEGAPQPPATETAVPGSEEAQRARGSSAGPAGESDGTDAHTASSAVAEVLDQGEDSGPGKNERLSLLRSNPAGLQLGDRVRLAILENPLAEEADIRKRLSDADFGGANVGRTELMETLRQLGLDTKIKRYNYFLHS